MQLSRYVPAYTHYITMQTKDVQQHHRGCFSIAVGSPVAPWANLSNRARIEPALPPAKLWETWGTAACHSLLYWLGHQQRRGSLPFSRNTVCVFLPCRYMCYITYKAADALPLACNLLSSYTQTVVLLGKETFFTAPPLWSQKAVQCQHFDGQRAGSS